MAGTRRTRATSKEPSSKKGKPTRNTRAASRASQTPPPPPTTSRASRYSSREATPTRASARLQGKVPEPVDELPTTRRTRASSRLQESAKNTADPTLTGRKRQLETIVDEEESSPSKRIKLEDEAGEVSESQPSAQQDTESDNGENIPVSAPNSSPFAAAPSSPSPDAMLETVEETIEETVEETIEESVETVEGLEEEQQHRSPSPYSEQAMDQELEVEEVEIQVVIETAARIPSPTPSQQLAIEQSEEIAAHAPSATHSPTPSQQLESERRQSEEMAIDTAARSPSASSSQHIQPEIESEPRESTPSTPQVPSSPLPHDQHMELDTEPEQEAGLAIETAAISPSARIPHDSEQEVQSEPSPSPARSEYLDASSEIDQEDGQGIDDATKSPSGTPQRIELEEAAESEVEDEWDDALQDDLASLASEQEIKAEPAQEREQDEAIVTAAETMSPIQSQHVEPELALEQTGTSIHSELRATSSELEVESESEHHQDEATENPTKSLSPTRSQHMEPEPAANSQVEEELDNLKSPSPTRSQHMELEPAANSQVEVQSGNPTVGLSARTPSAEPEAVNKVGSARKRSPSVQLPRDSKRRKTKQTSPEKSASVHESISANISAPLEEAAPVEGVSVGDAPAVADPAPIVQPTPPRSRFPGFSGFTSLFRRTPARPTVAPSQIVPASAPIVRAPLALPPSSSLNPAIALNEATPSRTSSNLIDPRSPSNRIPTIPRRAREQPTGTQPAAASTSSTSSDLGRPGYIPLAPSTERKRKRPLFSHYEDEDVFSGDDYDSTKSAWERARDECIDCGLIPPRLSSRSSVLAHSVIAQSEQYSRSFPGSFPSSPSDFSPVLSRESHPAQTSSKLVVSSTPPIPFFFSVEKDILGKGTLRIQQEGNNYIKITNPENAETALQLLSLLADVENDVPVDSSNIIRRLEQLRNRPLPDVRNSPTAASEKQPTPNQSAAPEVTAAPEDSPRESKRRRIEPPIASPTPAVAQPALVLPGGARSIAHALELRRGSKYSLSRFITQVPSQRSSTPAPKKSVRFATSVQSPSWLDPPPPPHIQKMLDTVAASHRNDKINRENAMKNPRRTPRTEGMPKRYEPNVTPRPSSSPMKRSVPAATATESKGKQKATTPTTPKPKRDALAKGYFCISPSMFDSSSDEESDSPATAETSEAAKNPKKLSTYSFVESDSEGEEDGAKAPKSAKPTKPHQATVEDGSESEDDGTKLTKSAKPANLSQATVESESESQDDGIESAKSARILQEMDTQNQNQPYYSRFPDQNQTGPVEEKTVSIVDQLKPLVDFAAELNKPWGVDSDLEEDVVAELETKDSDADENGFFEEFKNEVEPFVEEQWAANAALVDLTPTERWFKEFRRYEKDTDEWLM